MKFLRITLSLVIAGMLSISCQKVVELKVDEPTPQVAVEGLITNYVGESYVKLQWTKTYFSKEDPKAVRNAVVQISDNEGNVVSFAEAAPGMYAAPASFFGEIGRTYSLHVDYDGGTLQASSVLPDTTTILEVELVKATASDPRLEEGYHLVAAMQKSGSDEQFYKSEAYINGTRQMNTAEDLVVFNDDYYEDGEIITEVLAFWEEEDENKPLPGDRLSVRVVSIDKDTYDYYLALSDTPSQGGIFGKNPANVPTNIKGGLGLFQACSYVRTREVLVEE